METVSFAYYAPSTDTYGTAFNVTDVLVRSLNRDDQAFLHGETTVEGLTFHLPSAQLATEPQKLDKITRDGEEYIVQKVQKATLGVRYKAVANKRV